MKLTIGFLLLASMCFADSVLTLSAPPYTPGQPLILTVSKTGDLPSNIQITFNADGRTSPGSASVVGSALSAGKSIQCGGNGICVIWGLNQATIIDGPVAQFSIPIPSNVTGSLTFSITGQVESTPGGMPITTTVNPPLSVPSTISLPQPCDITGDGLVNISDVDAMRNQVLLGTFSAAYDLDHDSKVNVTDLAIEIKAYLGGTCAAQ